MPAWRGDDWSVARALAAQAIRLAAALRPAQHGGQYPPLAQMRQCNTGFCPIDCQVGDYGSWTAALRRVGAAIAIATVSLRLAPLLAASPAQTPRNRSNATPRAVHATVSFLLGAHGDSASQRAATQLSVARAASAHASAQLFCPPPLEVSRAAHRAKSRAATHMLARSTVCLR